MSVLNVSPTPYQNVMVTGCELDPVDAVVVLGFPVPDALVSFWVLPQPATDATTAMVPTILALIPHTFFIRTLLSYGW